MFIDIIKVIKKDLDLHKEKSREEFFADCVKNRLDKSLMSYEEYLENSVEYLKTKDPNTIIRRI